ncbi:MAG TPA: hypothetical protein VK204_13715 [Nocardioidaceae bacterium]|nr:hypothetical protein [Nocardioidaceae bacterium]
MIRSVLALATLGLVAVLGIWAAWATYDLAAIYSDPAGSGVEMFETFGAVSVFAVVLMVAGAAVAVALARGLLRRIAVFAATALVVASLGGMLVANVYGVEAKRVESAEPPRCGIGNRALDHEFRRIVHPGYFGGGSSSRHDCSYMLTARDIDAALDQYDRHLTDLGYDASRTRDGVVARRESFRFVARTEQTTRGEDYLTVSLRQQG